MGTVRVEVVSNGTTKPSSEHRRLPDTLGYVGTSLNTQFSKVSNALTTAAGHGEILVQVSASAASVLVGRPVQRWKSVNASV